MEVAEREPIRVETDRGLSIVRLFGLFTQRDVLALGTALARGQAVSGVHGTVLYTEGALLAFTADDMYRATRRRIGLAHLSKPMSYVVSPAHAETFYELAWKLAQHGIVRGVFTECGAAHRWVRERATAYQAQAICRTATSAR